MKIVERNTPEAAADTLAEKLFQAIRSALESKTRASLMLSGGRSPKMVLPRLASMELDWTRVDVSLTDDRWVGVEHPESNAGMVRACFLERGAHGARFHPLVTTATTPSAGLSEAVERFQDIPMPFDAVYLGMGPDGHIASLFPTDNVDDLSADSGPLVCVDVPPSAPDTPSQPRISLSLEAVSASNNILLHIVGAEKRAVLDSALSGAPTPRCPVSLLLHDQSLNVTIVAAA